MRGRRNDVDHVSQKVSRCTQKSFKLAEDDLLFWEL